MIFGIITQLGSFSVQTLAEFAFLSQQHPKWLQTFQKQLSNWMNQASPAEWFKLESQDPPGKLKKLAFEKSVKMLVNKKLFLGFGIMSCASRTPEKDITYSLDKPL